MKLKDKDVESHIDNIFNEYSKVHYIRRDETIEDLSETNVDFDKTGYRVNYLINLINETLVILRQKIVYNPTKNSKFLSREVFHNTLIDVIEYIADHYSEFDGSSTHREYIEKHFYKTWGDVVCSTYNQCMSMDRWTLKTNMAIDDGFAIENKIKYKAFWSNCIESGIGIDAERRLIIKEEFIYHLKRMSQLIVGIREAHIRACEEITGISYVAPNIHSTISRESIYEFSDLDFKEIVSLEAEDADMKEPKPDKDTTGDKADDVPPEDPAASKEAEDSKEKKRAMSLAEFNKKVGKLAQGSNDFKIRFKTFVDKITPGRESFYVKNLGKIPHLYEAFGDEAKVIENELYGDPVDILFNKVPNYLRTISKNILGEYKKFIDLYKKLMDVHSSPEMVKVVNGYITYKKVDKDANTKAIIKALNLDFRFKIGEILLKGNNVYGYTAESIALKKYPPVNHLIVSLFSPKPFLAPERRSVNSVFKSADSFTIMSNELQGKLSETAKSLNKLMDAGFISKDYEEFNQRMKIYEKDFAENFTRKNLLVKGFKQRVERTKGVNILTGYTSILESYLPVLKYVSSLSNAYYNTGMSIDQLARDAMKELLNQEKSKVDKTYTTGTKVATKDQKSTVAKVDKTGNDK